MAYIVVFNKLTEECAILEPTPEERMQLIIMDQMPTLHQLDAFYRQQKLHDNSIMMEREQRDWYYNQLLDMAHRCQDYVQEPVLQRNVLLVSRLRAALDMFVYVRTGCNRDIYRLRECLTPEAWQLLLRSKYGGRGLIYQIMRSLHLEYAVPEADEEQAIGSTVVETAKASNVVLTTGRDASTVETAAPQYKWTTYVSGDVTSNFAEVTDRWLTLGSFEWNTSQRQNTIIYNTVVRDKPSKVRRPILPLDAVYYSDSSPADMPNLVPFRVHAYWRGDMEVKIQVNSNKFQIGQLMCGFYYQAGINGNIQDKLNVYSLSQMDHVIVQASASNEAILRIPYNHMYPMIPTRKVPTVNFTGPILNMGELWIMVQNQLAATTTGPKKCIGSVLVRFIDSDFTGMSFGGYAAKPEAGFMQPIVRSAERVLNQVLAGFNRDAPTNITSPAYVVPTASHNWSAGKNVAEQTHVLRLDPAGQTAQYSNKNETAIRNVVNRYGLIRTVKWPTEIEEKGKRGAILLDMPAAPDDMLYMNGNDNAKSYVVPPVGIVASMFHQWRGSLELKFQFVASQFHTGRILVGYIPGYVSGPLTLREVKASPHVVFDLQEQREFSYIVPYIAYKPWWTRQQSGNYTYAASPAPSKLVVMVYNELVVMDSIVPYAYINVYMRAGPDFEVAVPVQPSISLSWNKDFVTVREDGTGAINGYYPYYYGVWHSFDNSQTLVARYGTTSDEVAEFQEYAVDLGPSDYLYYAYDPSIRGQYANVYKVSDGTSQIPQWAIIAQSGHGYAILIPFNNEQNCKTAARAIYVNKKSLSDPSVTRYALSASVYSPGAYCTGNPVWIARVVKQVTDVQDDSWVMPESNEDSTALAITTGPMLTTLNRGYNFYGESFDDLKDLARRYIMYAQIQLASLKKIEINKCTFMFHALPQGLRLEVGTPLNPNELFNRCREGPIPLIASLFRYYRGSLRYRICMPPELEAKVWIQHLPDRLYNEVRDQTVRLCHNIDTAQGVFNHGYANYIQYTNINGIIEFEVPFYNNTVNNVLQKPEGLTQYDAWGVSIGQIHVGIEWIGDLTLHQGKWISIYYALGDDMEFTQWVGGAQYLKLDDNFVAKPESPDEENITYAEIHKVPDDLDNIEYNTLLLSHERRLPKGEGIFSGFVSDVQATASTVVKDGIGEIKKEMATMTEQLCAEFANVSTQTDKATIAAVVGNFLHVIVNPKINTVVTSIVNVFISIGVFTVSMMSAAMDILKSVFTRLKCCDEATKPHDEPVTVAKPESADDDIMASWCSFLYNGVMSALNITIKKPKSWFDWQNILVKDLANSTRGANQIFIFVRNSMDCVRRIMDYILCRSNDVYNTMRLVESSPEAISSWCKEVLHLTDPLVRRESVGNVSYIDRVYDAQVFGQMMLADISGELRTEKNAALITKLYDKITLLKDDLIEMGEHPHVRKLPFTIYVYGEPGIGKSHLSTALCARLLRDYKYTTKKGLKCTLNPQSDYWDQCDHQPVLEIDDMWAVTTPGTLEKQLQTLFQVVSPIVLSPPKAAVEEKKMRYNPEIFYINSNRDFPVFNDVNCEAIWRRRNVLIKAVKEGRTVKGCPHCVDGVSLDAVDPSWVADFHHLSFYIAQSVTNHNTGYDGPYEYGALCEKLSEDFLANRAREATLFSNRVMEQELLDVSFDTDYVEGSISDKFAVLQAKRLAEYQKLYHHTLRTDMECLYATAKWTTRQGWDKLCVYPTVIKDKISEFSSVVTNPFTRYFVAKPESDGPSQFDETLNVLTDSNEEAVTYRAEYREHLILGKYEHDNIINHSDGKATVEACARLHDDGDTLEGMLIHYNTRMATMRDLSPRSVNSVEKILDFVMKDQWNKRSGVKCFCYHTSALYKDAILINNNLIFTLHGEEKNLCDRCKGLCILNSPYLTFLWYRRWLYNNPSMRLAYSRGRKERLPAYFRQRATAEVLKPDSIVRQLLLALNDIWQRNLAAPVKRLYAWLKKIWPKTSTILLGLGLFASFAIPIASCWQTMKCEQAYWTAARDELYQQGSIVQQWNAAPQAYDNGNISVRAITGGAAPAVVKPQASQQCDAVINIVKKNTVLMKYYHENHGTVDSFRAVVIRGRQLLVLRHYLEIAASKKGKITRMTLVYDFESDKRTNGCEIDVNYFELPKIAYAGETSNGVYESNFVTLELPPNIPEFKSLVKFICPWNEWNSIGRVGTLVMGAKKIVRELPITWVDHQPTFIGSNGPSAEISMGKCFRYPIHGAGMCGSILLCDNKEKPIIGMHVAGVDGARGFGIAEPLYSEMITGLPTLPERPQVEIVEPDLLDVDNASVNLGNLIYKIGVINPKHAQHQSGKTRIKPSKVHGVFEIRTAPNPLVKNDPRLPKSNLTPLEAGCMKHGLPNLQLPALLVKKAEDHLLNKLLAKVKPIRAVTGVLSEQEAICGMENIPELRALSFKTSAGFPLSQHKPMGAQGKRFLFTLKETEKGYVCEKVHPKLRQLMDVTMSMRKKGIKPMTVFSDCLKDTTLPIEKNCILGKTRIFSISPIQYTIPFKQYMGDFMAAYRRTRFDANHAIGINVNGSEWSDLACRLQQKGPKLITGDYSNYGPALNLELAEAACRIIMAWYKRYEHVADEEVTRVRAILLQELLSCYHLCGDLIYRVPCGIPSGSPITDILNSLVGNLYIYVAWQGITGKNMNEYEKHCYEVVYGDDLILNISDEIAPIFNTTSMHAFFGKYLIKFTDADKNGDIIDYHTLDNASFLKHTFKPHPFRPYTIIAALDRVSVEGCANWIGSNGIDTDEALTKQNCVMSCRLAYGHGENYFNSVRDKLLKALQDVGLFQSLPTWEELDYEFFEAPTSTFSDYTIGNYYITE
nr:MAG: RNA-dependent RNA polymerase [Iflaviridae-like virus 2]